MVAASPRFDLPALRRFFEGAHAPARARLRALLATPEFALHPDHDAAGYRQAVFGCLRALAREGFGAAAYPAAVGGQDDFAQFLATFEVVACHDVSLAIKYAVQFSLWGGSVHRLGTAQHHARYLPAIGTAELPGCFGMTEIGHGSNVRDLETVARFDPADGGSFLIHSPNWAAGKNYIGNATCHGQAATVFAQLEVGGRRHGVHAFVVPLRDGTGRLLPGVRVEDNGRKMGENGVDNGRIWFDQVRVPRENLLDRFASVDAEGNYTSPIAHPGLRFLTMLGTLVGGRIVIAAAGLSAAQAGLTLAVRYAARRRQFKLAPGDAAEARLLDYPTQQRRLLPLVANAVALRFLKEETLRAYLAEDPASERLAAGLKSWATWNTTRTLQTCREACGGEGYVAANRIPDLKADSDIFTTFEGDNTVLTVWVGRQLLRLPAAEAAGSGADPAGSAEAETELAAEGGAPSEPRWAEPAGQRQLRELFRQRELFLRREVEQVSADAAAAGDPHAAALRPQWPLFHYAQAHVERVLLESCQAGIAAAPEEGGVRAVLATVGELFALHLLEERRGWYLENGLLNGKTTRAVSRRIDALCAELAPAAVALVDAFGVPEHVLAVPMLAAPPPPAG